MRLMFSLLSGMLFGAGLFISGMTDTTKVQGWLDIFGAWDPTLAFVLGGAIIPMFFAWRMTKGRRPVTTPQFPPQPPVKIDRRLAIGSLLFGAGWGLSGLCPGPAMASLGYGGVFHWVFFAAMLVGMWLTPHILRLVVRPATA
ncbi:DUF6691 family protein [Lentibacter sp. XHP0401]|jgi:uncharacterized protein|uniref:DUF6691 family protein n=1 Tax=Lentibacter sp. XHP0401 TaxID=2984334 RepID=UPI0021E94D7C|nr:DUF6691 family protein [Lentibacter sp. XHP0401]MCV2893881.1 hypothetical protein [Lentibacter sp. XHP0401]